MQAVEVAPALVRGAAVEPAALSALREAATLRPELAWTRGMHISEARNAHFSHTPEYLERALRGDFNSIEADLRVANGNVVVAHNQSGEYFFTLEDWIDMVRPSGRMMRFDIKSADAFAPTMDVLRRAQLDDWRTSVNLTVARNIDDVDVRGTDPVNAFSEPVRLDAAKQIREILPNAHVGLNVHDYSPRGFAELASIGAELGAPSMVAIEAQRLEPWMLDTMHRRGVMVGAWNYPPDFVPEDVAGLTRSLRERGVDGQIDLRGARDPLLHA